MATVKVKPSSIDNIEGYIKRMGGESETAKTLLSYAINGLEHNMEIMSKRGIQNKLSSLKTDITIQIAFSQRLQTNFGNATRQIVAVDSKYSQALKNIFGEVVTYSRKNGNLHGFFLDNKIEKKAVSAGLFLGANGILSKSQIEEPLSGLINWGSNIINVGKDMVGNIGKATEDMVGNVVKVGKDCVSWVGDKIDNVADWYKENEKEIKAYGKAALKIGSGVIKIVGSVGTMLGTAGGSTPLAVMGIITAGNDIINGVCDITYASTEQYDMVGQTNVLKDTLVENAGQIGEYFGNSEIGETVGNIVYTGVNVVTFLDGADKMLKSFGKANIDLTNTADYSFAWGKTSFDDIADAKIEFALEPDYFIRKVMKVAPSSTGNLIYEAGKNVVKTFEKAWKLGGELSSYIK